MSDLLFLTLAPGVVLPLAYVRAGEFIMGEEYDYDPDAWDVEAPRHHVYLDHYWIGQYQVTVAQFAAFVSATGYQTDNEQPGSAGTWLHPHGTDSNVDGKRAHPVTCVSWYDATAFCKWVSRVTRRAVQLPSEAQWEKAARGTDARRYPWGSDAPDKSLCNFDEEVDDTTPVGRYSPRGDSPYHCADMAGNVFEWCLDWYDGEYYKQSPSCNPTGPAIGTSRVVRGGSFFSDQGNMRCSDRAWGGPGTDFSGFRVVVVLPFFLMLPAWCRHLVQFFWLVRWRMNLRPHLAQAATGSIDDSPISLTVECSGANKTVIATNGGRACR